MRQILVEHSSALVGYAVLRANFNASAPSYIDNFRGFVLGVLAERQPKHLTRNVIASSIQEVFGIDIPDLVVDKIVKRTRHTKLIDADGDGYFLTARGSERAPAVRVLRDKYVRQQKELEDRFRAYIAAEFPEHKELLDAAAAEELASYLERHAVPLIANASKGRALPTVVSGDSGIGFEFGISKFVAHLADRDSIGFGYLEEAAKGAILASVVSLDTSSFSNSLSTLSVYIDTPVLIDLLGFGGPVAMRATEQLLELLQRQGAKAFVLAHSLRELDGVLDRAGQYAKVNNTRAALPIDLHFQDQGWSAADIELARLNVAGSLDARQIETIDKPGDYHAYGLDEAALDSALQEAVHYKSDKTRRFDVESLSAIHRLRKGSSRGSLDRCVAVLLTDNIELVRASEHVDERHEWPLAMTDSALAGILWARSPTMSVDLPRQMVLASAYAGMQPDPRLWSRYVDEVDTLESRGTVSPDEAILLRSTTAGRDALMEETLGLAAKSVSPVDVLRRIQEEISEPVRAEAKKANVLAASATQSGDERAAALTAELESVATEQVRLERERGDIDTAIETRGRRSARVRIKVALWILVALLVGASSLRLFPPTWLKDVPEWVSWLIGILTFLTVALAIIDSVGRGTVAKWLEPLELWLADRLIRKRRKQLGLI